MSHLPYRRANVLLTGDYETVEFRAAVAWLETRCNIARRADLADAVLYLRNAKNDPLLIVVVQSYPGQFSADQIEQLHRQSPLSRIVALLGSWCEGEARSGRPWPGVIRVLWHQFEGRLSRLLDDSPTWDLAAKLPRTSSVTEQLDNCLDAFGCSTEGLIAIRTRYYADFDALGEALRQAGYATVWLPETSWRNIRGVTAIVWDGGHCQWSQPQQMNELRTLIDMAPVVALMDFPRHDDKALLGKVGVSAIVSRPFLLSDLTYQVSLAIGESSLTKVVA